MSDDSKPTIVERLIKGPPLTADLRLRASYFPNSALAHCLCQAANYIQRLEAERDEATVELRTCSAALREATKLMTEYATAAGFAKGKLEGSEAVGAVDSWREQCEGLEAKLAAALSWKDRALAAESALSELQGVKEERDGMLDWKVAWYALDADNAVLRSKLSAALGELSVARDTLKLAAAQFRAYEVLHHDKMTEDGDRKADVNQRFAELCEQALAAQQPSPEGENE